MVGNPTVGQVFGPAKGCKSIRPRNVRPRFAELEEDAIDGRGSCKQPAVAVDWDLLLRFRDAGAKMERLPRFLAAFRVHPNQKTTTEMLENGRAEMDRLRERSLGRAVTTAEIGRALSPYLRRHFIHHKLYRLGVLRY